MASTAMVSPAVMRGREPELFLAFLGHRLLDHLLAAVETVGRDAMTQVRLAAGAVDRQRGALQGIVRAAHAPRGGGLSALLNCHGLVSCRGSALALLEQLPQVRKRSLRLFHRRLVLVR